MCPRVTDQYKTEVKEKIVQAAITTFSKYGYDKTRMDDIAKSAKLGKGTLYLYFKSKEELFYDISENSIKELKEQLSKLFSKKEDLVQDAEKFYDQYRNLIHDSEKVSFEMIAESSRNPKLRKALYEQRMKVYDIVIDYLRRQIEKGFFRKDMDVNAIASGLVALYDGLTISKLLGISEYHNKKAWTQTIRAIFTGIN
ncbi:MAG TPA: TetR/AcrR family transcriptional regulator [Nitrososphaeraceae archaeon]|jgi:TetR/AcrR family transcriptional regulator, repressor for uid operon|nr:TetR/AcrR family transcriptional regulator [Nitrososphaeraceae archaeon]HZC47916.1 TetR/AcrR family transcriptional regulator [Nitrososphaeraceae archaeon]